MNTGPAPRFDRWPTLPAMLFDQAARLGERPMLRVKRDGQWRQLSWRHVADQVLKAARGLADLGVGPGDRVCIVAENRPEWLIADFAVMSLGAISVPAYTTIAVPDYAHVLRNSGSCVAIASGTGLARKVFAAMAEAPGCRSLVVIGDARLPASDHVNVLSWDTLLDPPEKPALPPPDRAAAAEGAAEGAGEDAAEGVTEGAAGETGAGSASIAAPPVPPVGSTLPPPITAETASTAGTADDVACLIYTSGTGGAPKGVMLSHRAVMANCIGAYDVLRVIGLDDEVFLSCLPLSHAYEHSCGQMFPVSLGAEIAYVEGVDKIGANMGEVKPSVVLVVPRLMEVVQQRITREVDRQGGAKAKLFNLALELGKERYHRGGRLPFWKRPLDLALDRLVRAKVRAKLGGRIKALVSGGAALNPEVGLFFDALGFRLLQGYGQTEAAPLISVNRFGNMAHHTVGQPVKGCEVRIGPDGEILARGPNVMEGYWQDPASTERALADGWLHTGDVGHLDEEGRIVITDRKKDILVTSGGENVSPAKLEGRLTLEPEIAQAVVTGDKRPYVAALIVPDPEIAADWAKRRGKATDLPSLCRDPEFRKLVSDAVDRANANLAGVERIRKFALVCEAFTIENGLMTPTMKVKRSAVQQKLGEVIAGLYDGS